MSSEAISHIRPGYQGNQPAEVVELRPDSRSFLERHKRTIRNAAIGLVAVGATLAVGNEIIEYISADMADKLMDGGSKFLEDPAGIEDIPVRG